MMTTKPKNVSPALARTLTAIRDRAARIEAEAKAERLEAERAIKQLARGTREVEPPAPPVLTVPLPKTLGLAEKIEAMLRGPFAPLDIRALAAAVEEPVARVLAHLKKLRSMACPTRSREDADEARQIFNLGTDDDPRWIWVVGDETSPEDLHEMVRKLLSYKPLTFAELFLATGARRGRLSGRLVQFQRDEELLVDLNKNKEGRKALWSLGSAKRRRGPTGKFEK